MYLNKTIFTCPVHYICKKIDFFIANQNKVTKNGWIFRNQDKI